MGLVGEQVVVGSEDAGHDVGYQPGAGQTRRPGEVARTGELSARPGPVRGRRRAPPAVRNRPLMGDESPGADDQGFNLYNFQVTNACTELAPMIVAIDCFMKLCTYHCIYILKCISCFQSGGSEQAEHPGQDVDKRRQHSQEHARKHRIHRRRENLHVWLLQVRQCCHCNTQKR